MVTLLLLLTILHGADGWFLQIRSTGNWTEAKLACSREGGRLPLPGDDVDNSALAEHLQAINVTSAWIEPKWFIKPWHVDGVIIREQGCFGVEKLQFWNPDAKLTLVDTLSSCETTCINSNSVFAGFREHRHSCVCLNSTWPIGRRLYSDCTRTNYNVYMVVKSTQSTDPIVNLRWRRQSGNRGGLCALTFLSRPNGMNLRLEEDYCYNRHHSLCCIHSDNDIKVMKMPLYTWFEAHLECSLLDGFIASQRSKCVQLNTSLTVFNTTRFWSRVRAWVWYIDDTLALEHRFTNWSHEQPSLESGSCVVVTQDGAWESISCDESKTVVCETDERTPTDSSPLSTSSPSTSIQTETMSSSTTEPASTDPSPPSPSQSDSVSTGGVPSTQRQRAPGNRSSIAGIAAGTVVGALVVLGLVGAVIWVLVRRKGKTDRGYPTRLDNSVYSKENDDVIISRSEIGPHETTIRENSVYGWSEKNRGADSDLYFSESTATTVAGTGSGGQSKPREVSSVHMTVVDNELYSESDRAQTSHSEPVYSLEQLCDGQGHDEPKHNNDDDDDDHHRHDHDDHDVDDDDDDGDFESVNEAVSRRELQPYSQLSRHDSVV